ncbi:MAG: hypothetical protein ABW149_12725 [Sedimenticola sp.]
MSRIKPVLAVILSLVTLFGGIAWAETLILNTGTRNPYTTEDHRGFLDQLIGELFRRVDLQAEVLVYDASARALANANNGIDAGVAMRIKGLERKYPNLVMVPEKVIDNDFVAYSLQYDFQITEWNSLTPHLVGYILGWQIFERNMPQATPVEKAIGPEQLFLLLEMEEWMSFSTSVGRGSGVQDSSVSMSGYMNRHWHNGECISTCISVMHTWSTGCRLSWLP